MKVLLTGFYGKYNASNILVDMIDTKADKLILTNSFVKLEQELNDIALEDYDLILMFGINKFLKNEIQLEQTAKLVNELKSSLEMTSLKLKCDKYIKTSINKIPTKYLCNSAYYYVLKKNSKTLFIHIPGVSKISNMDLLIDMIYELIGNKSLTEIIDL